MLDAGCLGGTHQGEMFLFARGAFGGRDHEERIDALQGLAGQLEITVAEGARLAAGQPGGAGRIAQRQDQGQDQGQALVAQQAGDLSADVAGGAGDGQLHVVSPG
jgi:hypothetical protein